MLTSILAAFTHCLQLRVKFEHDINANILNYISYNENKYFGIRNIDIIADSYDVCVFALKDITLLGLFFLMKITLMT